MRRKLKRFNRFRHQVPYVLMSTLAPATRHLVSFSYRSTLRPFLALVLVILSLTAMPSQAADPRAVAARMMADMPDSTWIRQGNGDRIVYMFFDPNCPYCHHVYDNLKPIIAARKDLQFRWVPLGMLTSSSEGKAAAIIQAKDPLKAFHQSEENYGFLDSDNGGGIKPIKNITEKTKTDLVANYSVLEDGNVYGIPVILFQGDDGKPFFMDGEHSTKQLKAILDHVAKGEYGGGKALN